MSVLAKKLVVDSVANNLPTISFSMECGQKLLLEGSPGIGKSVLLQTLAGHRPPKTGRVTWDGCAAPTKDSLADTVFLASDEVLMGATIFDNLRLSNFALSESEAWAAVETVGLCQIIRQLGGLEFRIHNTDNALSSSQRRRLVLARALVAAPRLLLIDKTLDFLGKNNTGILECFLGVDAPWTALVTTDDPSVRAMLQKTILADGEGLSGE